VRAKGNWPEKHAEAPFGLLGLVFGNGNIELYSIGTRSMLRMS